MYIIKYYYWSFGCTRVNYVIIEQNRNPMKLNYDFIQWCILAYNVVKSVNWN